MLGAGPGARWPDSVLQLPGLRAVVWQQRGFVHLFVNTLSPGFAEKSESQVPARERNLWEQTFLRSLPARQNCSAPPSWKLAADIITQAADLKNRLSFQSLAVGNNVRGRGGGKRLGLAWLSSPPCNPKGGTGTRQREVCSGAGGTTTILHSAEQQLGQLEPSYPLSCSFLVLTNFLPSLPLLCAALLHPIPAPRGQPQGETSGFFLPWPTRAVMGSMKSWNKPKKRQG